MPRKNVVELAPPIRPKEQTSWLVNTGIIVGDSVALVCSEDPNSTATLAPQGSIPAQGSAALEGSKVVSCVACGREHPVCNLIEGLEWNCIDTTEGGVLIDMGDFLAAMLRQKAAAPRV